MKRIKNETGVNGQPVNSIPQSDSVAVRLLTAASNAEIAIPSGATHAMYQYYGSDQLYIRQGGAAFTAVPSPPLNDQEFMVNPDMRIIESSQTKLHAIAETGGLLVINFYGG